MAFCKAFLLWAFATILLSVDAIPTISAVGNKFFDSEGRQWFIKGKVSATRHVHLPLTQLTTGMAYQLIEDDPLVKTEQCERDADLMNQLGVNAIRVYHVNETAEHQGCMNAFARAGIYCFIDLDTFHIHPLRREQTNTTWRQG